MVLLKVGARDNSGVRDFAGAACEVDTRAEESARRPVEFGLMLYFFGRAVKKGEKGLLC